MRIPILLQTRVGRRIVLLFVVSALLPVSALALIGYVQVKEQLLGAAHMQLAQAVRFAGMGIVDRLRAARDAVQQVDPGASSGPADSTGVHRVFSSATLVRPGAEPRVLWGTLAPPTESSGDAARSRLIVAAGPQPTVWMARDIRGGRLWAAIRQDFLFANLLELAGSAGDATALCVRDGLIMLYCASSDSSAGDRVNASWNLFLAYDYGAPPWSIDVSRPAEAVLAPVRNFRRTLLATAIAILGLVVILSNIQVRRSLQPLKELELATERLARRDFSRPVEVHSRDEFEGLAGSFNGMALQLEGQFRSNAELIQRLDELSYGALAALARAVDASSSWTAGHSERVTTLGLRMADRLGLDEGQKDALRRGGLLHDVGKIGISPLILDKPGQLTAEEYARIREHPAMGARILAPLAAFADAIPIVLHHHERYDGAGYPAGLKGEAIPFLARLLSVADVYDALVSSRPYRSGWEYGAALENIRILAGSQFDPAMVEVFFQVVEAEGDTARFAAVVSAES